MEFQIRMASGQRGQPSTHEWTVQSQFEILSFGAGYGFPGRLSLLYSGDHDQTPVVDASPARNMDNWVEMQVSNDSFTTICWWGYLNMNKPRGIRTEGIEYEAIGLEAFLDNYLVNWNDSTYNTYNANNNRDYTSPAGTNWTLKQILADILEHMLGIQVATATWKSGSMVYPHHTRVDLVASPFSVDVSSVKTIPLMPLDAPRQYSVFADGNLPYRGPTFTWDRTELNGITDLDLQLEEIRLAGVYFWSLLTDLVGRSTSTNCFLDLNGGGSDTVVVRFHDWSSSTAATVYAGVRGEHISSTDDPGGTPTSAYDLADSKLQFSLDGVKTHIIIEGRGKVLETSAKLAPAWIDFQGNITHPGDVGKLWVVRDQQYLPLIEGQLTSIVNVLTGEGERGPLLMSASDTPAGVWAAGGGALVLANPGAAGAPNFFTVQLHTGIVRTDHNLSNWAKVDGDGNLTGDSYLEVASLYAAAFRVEAGPGGQAYEDYGYISQAVHIDEDMLHPTRPGGIYYSLARVQKLDLGNNESGSAEFKREKGWNQEGAGDLVGYGYPGGVRDDTAMMQALANRMLDRMSTERQSADLTVRISLYGGAGVISPEYLLVRKASLGNLNKWSSVGLQVMGYTVNPRAQTMVMKCSNEIDRGINWPFSEWKRRHKLETGFNGQLIKLQEYRHEDGPSGQPERRWESSEKSGEDRFNKAGGSQKTANIDLSVYDGEEGGFNAI